MIVTRANPMKTAASKKHSIIARSFCVPWKVRFCSGSCMSISSIFAPAKSWRKMLARTMGPIPTVMSEPTRLAVTTCRKSEVLTVGFTPAAMIWYMVKKQTSAMPVHISFSVRFVGREGAETSGRKCNTGFRKSRELPIRSTENNWVSWSD